MWSFLQWRKDAFSGKHKEDNAAYFLDGEINI